jgi:fatty-acyl-CoA synthase
MSVPLHADTLPALLRDMAQRFPECEALVDARSRLSYAQLAHRVADVAAGLQVLGVGRGDKVAILLGNRAEWVIATFAITSLGAVAVSLNTWWTARELEYALQHSESRYVISARHYLRHDHGAVLEEIRAGGAVPSLVGVIGVGEELPSGWIPFDSLRGGHAATELLDVAAADDIAYLLYTSGSTSRPKGVPLRHGSLVHNMWCIGERQHLMPQDRLWLAVSLFWGYGCANALLAAFTHGVCVVLQESFDAGEALRLIEAERCSVVYGTPNIIQALHEHPEATTRDLSSLRKGTTLGTPEQVRRAILLGARQVCNVYGMTETYGNSHVTDADDLLELRLVSVGKPLPGFRQRIVDPHTGQEVPAGQVGEIRLKGHVMPGYYKDPAQTAACFDEEGWFKTGDLGCVDDEGRLYFRGRLKEMVKTGGINVSPAEIEAVLLAHPDVQYAVVVGVPDPKRDEILAAVVVPKEQCTLSEDAILGHCRAQLAAYKVPRLLRFAPESALPLTTTGKVQKNRIAATFFN